MKMIEVVRTRVVKLPAVLALLLLIGLGLPSAPASAASTVAGANAASVFVVTSSGDAADSNVNDGICQSTAGGCTLRAAIEQANQHRGADTITFAIAGTGVRQITPATELPALNDHSGGTLIDGYSQPGAVANTAADGSNATIKIELVGNLTILNGLSILSSENEIRGLSLYGFENNMRLLGEGANGNRIVGNFIGPTAAAGQVPGTAHGIKIDLGPDRNVIGTPALADRNVISGNYNHGITVNHGETSENVIQNNVIGLKPDLSGRLTQRTGIDLQWWTWGNLVGGLGQNEGNLISGNKLVTHSFSGGVDLSHSATDNAVVGNYFGTLADGNTATSYSANNHGIVVKDDAYGNYIGHNVIGNSNYDGIRLRHNYNQPNTYANNLIGVGINGGDIGNQESGVRLTGQDQYLIDNTFGFNTSNAVWVEDHAVVVGGATRFQPKLADGITVRQSEFVSSAGLPIDIAPIDHNINDVGDIDTGVNGLLNHAEITASETGAVRGTACANCEVEFYSHTAVGSLSWFARAQADATGAWGLSSPQVVVGQLLTTVAIAPDGNTSESNTVTVANQPTGLTATEPASLARIAAPAVPAAPAPYQSEPFDCAYGAGNLTWDDANANAYYIWATTNGVERYLGGHTGTSLTTAAADSYRVEHWEKGYRVDNVCDGPGPFQFTCSYSNGTLTWGDAGANAYYIWATANGVERYLGGHTGTSLATAEADSYRVEHWNGGQTEADCNGPGPIIFSCSWSAGTLSWVDAGANAYYIWSTTNGIENYHGGHPGTSLQLAAASSYRVEHWNGGQTETTCASS